MEGRRNWWVPVVAVLSTLVCSGAAGIGIVGKLMRWW
jgi:hypothetical protein